MNKENVKETENDVRLLVGNETVEELEKQDRFRRGRMIGKRRRGILFLLLAVGLSAAVVIVALAVNLSMVSVDPDVTATVTAKENIRQETTVNGTVVSNHIQVFYAPVDAPLSVKLPETGRTVTAGEVLVEFDTSDLENELVQSSLNEESVVSQNADTVAKGDQSASDLEQASADVTSLEADVKQVQQNLYAITEAISQRQRELSESLSTLQNQLLQLQNEQGDLQTEITRLETEQQSAEASGSAFDDTRLNEARSELADKNNAITSLQQQINSAPTAETDPTLADYNLQLQEEQDHLTELQSDLSEAKSRVDAAEQSQLSQDGREALEADDSLARLKTMTAQEKVNLAKEGIRSDFDGVVTASAGLDSGSLVTEGMELFTISSRTDLSVEIQVPRSDYDRIETGQTADVTIGGKTYQGTVDSVSSLIETDDKGASYLSAKVRIENPDESIVIGQDAEATIQTASADQVLCIPSESLNSGVDGDFVYIVNDKNQIEKRIVTTGILAENKTEIVSGLSEGEIVLKKLPDGVAVGDQVHAVIEKENQ